MKMNTNPENHPSKERAIRSRFHFSMSSVLFLCSLFCFSLINLPRKASGAMSEPLLGGEYVPTTDVGHITDLTELVEAIENTTDNSFKGLEFYKKTTDLLDTSLESLSTSTTASLANRKTNPLYSIYMYGLYRSPNGNGYEQDIAREEMEFIGKPVYSYGNTIVLAEFNKPSGYDSVLTAETIRATNMWMATANALYEGVNLCKKGRVSSIDDANYVDPIDKAAAFWFGTHDDAGVSKGGSLYAWARRMDGHFFNHVEDTTFTANGKILECLKELQMDLANCLSSTTEDSVKEELAYKMRIYADDVTRYMTIPLVQSLIYYSADLAGNANAGVKVENYVILYALVSLPPIRVCNSDAFNDLYERLVTNPEDGSLSENLKMLENLYVCLQITCDQVGMPNFACEDPPDNISIAGYEGTSDVLLQSALVDLDIRTIGTLVEMEAYDAALDVYKRGRFSKDDEESYGYVSVRDTMLDYNNGQNYVANSLKSEYGEDFANIMIDSAIMGTGNFSTSSPKARRAVVEDAMAIIVLHSYAITAMYTGIDNCNEGKTDTYWWDDAVASLVGWAEGTESGGSNSNGFLFYEFAQKLCTDVDLCNIGDDSEVNRLLMLALTDGKQNLLDLDCSSADEDLAKVELLIETVLVDSLAYYVEQIDKKPSDEESLAHGYIVATALVPLMRKVSSAEADTVKIFVDEVSYGYGNCKDEVFEALNAFVSARGINCDMLTRNICAGDSNAETTDGETSMSTTTPAIIGNDVGQNEEGIPSGSNGVQSSSLLSGAYSPTSNVDHVIKLTELLDAIEESGITEEGLSFYTQLEGGVSLQSLSTGSQLDYVKRINPIYIIYMYGLWISDDGDNDSNSYSGKVFDDEDLANFGDTIVRDEFGKASGYDPLLTAETIRVVNMWMAMTTELYKAVASCRDGSSSGANPVDFAAALWFGNHQNAEASEGASLFAWAKRAEISFVTQKIGEVNDDMIAKLNSLQGTYEICKDLSDKEEIAIQMKYEVDEITKIMIVPLVRNLIVHLAAQSGIAGKEAGDEIDYMVLYSLSVLPMISICDEDVFDDLYTDLVKESRWYDSSNFSQNLKLLQDRFACLGISCSDVGESVLFGPTTSCSSQEKVLDIAGYSPTSAVSFHASKIDLDISTILTFIIMEANDLAMDVYNFGRNMKEDDGSYNSIRNMSNPRNQQALEIYNTFVNNGVNKAGLTYSSIEGIDEFRTLSPLATSAAASLSLAAIDLHFIILDNMYEAINMCNDLKEGWDDHWDIAVAVVVGWAEGVQQGGSELDGYLIFNVAQQLCARFDSCDSNGNSVINIKIIEEFKNGQELLKNSLCDDAKVSAEAVETLLQTILVDNLAYRSKFSNVTGDEANLLLAFTTANALIPLMRSLDEESANTLESNLGTFPLDEFSVGEVLSALKQYVHVKGIDCSLLGSSICDYMSSVSDGTIVIEPNNSGHTLADGEYTPITNVESISSLSSVLSAICSAESIDDAKSIFSNNNTAGLTIESMSLNAKSDEILFNQYVSALSDGVDKIEGSFLFDGKPAVEYANTITMDAFDTSVALGCESTKILNIYMWVSHKLYEAVQQCKDGNPAKYSAIDEAAALWIGNPTTSNNKGGLLFDLAETLGMQFSHAKNEEKMTHLNREIVNRLKYAQQHFFADTNRCLADGKAVDDLRIVTKEISSYMAAVLAQGLIHSMLEERDAMEKREYVELFAFAFLPHIKTCGREKEYENLHTMLVGVFEESTAQDVLSSVQSHYNCLGLKCDDVGRHVNSDINMACLDSSLDLVGYSPVNATKTNMAAKLDLDAVAIYQLMSVENFDASKKIYLDGYNYYDYDDTTYGFISLYDLTQSSTIGYTNFSTYSLYSKYLEESPGDFAHSIVIDAFEKTGKFQTASGNQRREAVMQVISSFISYISSLEALHFAVNQCDSNSATAITAWDGGAALLIGSIEGEEVGVTGGSSRKDGYFMYSLSKLICNHFDTCIADGTDSEINKQLLEKLTQGQTAIQDGLCTDAEQGLESIKSLLVVPLIQSILYYVDKDSDLEIATVAGYVSTMALSPIIDAIDSTSSETIEAVMSFPPSSLPSGQNKVETVYNAFRAVLSDQKSFIDCQLVSTIHSMCDQVNAISSDVESFNVDEPTTMSNGLYIAKNFVGDRSAIAKDISDIQDFLDSKDVSGAKFVYDHGENSKIYNENGMPSGKRSISSFSVNAGNDMRTDPTYNLFVHGLSDENDYLGKSVLNYADSFVNLLFDSSDRRLTALAPEAMVSLHVWMQVAHKLHTAYAACKESIATFGRRNMAEISDPSLLIDEAAAYWIGDNQSTGSSSKGHLLYALTELIGEKFETMDKDSQSSVNSRIIDLFNQAKNHVAISDSCSTSEDSHLELRKIVTELIPMMAIPLLRCLYYYLSTGDNERVKLYAVSVLPLFSHCSPSTFLELKNDLIDHDIDELDKEYIFSRIQSMYDCLGLTCDVVGYMPSDDSTRCDDSGSKILAGYDSRTDRKAVVEAARVDVDARAIDIFINNGIYLFNESEDAFAASYECYKYGHSIDVKSSSYGPLHSLATNTNRDVIPSFSLFRRYFNNDDDYADSLIAAAFTKTGLFEDATLEQRRRVIAFSLRYMVTHMAILEKLYSSHEYCKASNNEAAASALDAAAAYAIGSMEGVEDGGSFDGNLLFMLAKRMCVHFGTCAATNNAKVNEHIVSLFYAGQGEVEAGACESLMKTITEIETDLLVPLIQGMLFASLENELSTGPKIAPDGLFPEGYVLSQSILPLINDASTSSAKDIENVMVGGFPNVIASSVDHQKVLLAVKNALPNMGVDCEQVGSIAGRSLCTGLLSISPASGTASTWFAASTIFASLATTFIL